MSHSGFFGTILRHLGSFWGHLERFCDLVGRRVEPNVAVQGHLGVFRGHFGVLTIILEASWNSFGRPQGHFAAMLESCRTLRFLATYGIGHGMHAGRIAHSTRIVCASF